MAFGTVAAVLSARVLGLFAAGVIAATSCASSNPAAPRADAVVSDGPTVTVDRDAQTTLTAAPATDPSAIERPPSTTTRVDLDPTGNRVIAGRGAFTDVTPLAVGLGDGQARWILPTGPDEWTVFLDDGSTIRVEVGNGRRVTAVEGLAPGSVPVDEGPPLLVDGEFVSAPSQADFFGDPLPDTRVVSDGIRSIAFAGPSDRYAHGVLGDSIEATTIEALGADGSVETLVRLDDPDVFEAVSPMLADVDGDGVLEIVATVANAATGARIAVYGPGGALESETPAIGRGNRWRNLLGVAPIGPNGEVELIDVQTPHIGGILQFFRDDGSGTLTLVASTAPYSTHAIGSRNLDLGIVTDADGDGDFDVLLPSQDQRSLAVVTRDASSDSGTREVFRIDLGARVTTNVAAVTSDGTVGYAVGLDDGRVLFWPRSA